MIMNSIDLITRHHILGTIAKGSSPDDLAFRCHLSQGAHLDIFAAELEFTGDQGQGIHRFTYRHSLISALQFCGITDIHGNWIALPSADKNFFAWVQQKIGPHISTRTRIAEIGALTAPLFSKEFHDIKYVDYVFTDELVKKHPEVALKSNEFFVNVDILAEEFFMNDRDLYDIIYSAHVLEHPPSLFRYLNKMTSKVCHEGVVAAILPDKRFIFDKNRSVTSIAEALGAYVSDQLIPSPAQVIDYCLHEYTKPTIEMIQDANYLNSLYHAYGVASAAVHEYIDCHCSVYDAKTFLTHCLVFMQLNLLSLHIEAVDTMFNGDILVIFRNTGVRQSSLERFHRSLDTVNRFLDSSGNV